MESPLKKLLAAGLAAILSSCQTTPVSERAILDRSPSDWSFPDDASIDTGTLPNGLRWYSQALPDNGHNDRVELRLRIRAGSLEEDPDQSGLAHFVEHMAFNGTKHFPKMQIIQFLEASGVTFGSDINAYTGFDETVYKLSLPADQPALLAQGFQILYDWASAVSFDASEVTKEALVVESEWRHRGGAVKDMGDEVYQYTYAGTRYARRLPIGKMAVVRNATPARLRAYYQRWYRPDNAEIYVVYPQRLTTVEQQIRNTFVRWQAPPTPARQWQAGAVDMSGVRVKTLSSKYLDACRWRLFLPTRTGIEDPDQAAEAAYAERLLGYALSSRFAQLSNSNDTKLYSGEVDLDRFLDGSHYLEASFYVAHCDAWAGLKEGVNELKRLQRFGLTASEFEIAKAQVIANLDLLLADLQSGTAAERMDWLLDNAANGQAQLDSIASLQETKRIAQTLSLAVVNGYLAQAYPADRALAYYYYPKDKAPKARNWPAMYRKAWRYSAKAPQARELDQLALDYRFPGTIIVRQDRLAEHGLYQWTLSNGIAVVLKPSQQAPGQVRVSGVLRSGLGQIAAEDYVAAYYWPQLRLDSGLGGLDLTDLQDRLASENISQKITMRGEFTRISLAGKASSTGALLQLMNGALTESDYDPALTVGLVFGYANYLRSVEDEADRRFDQAYQSAVYGKSASYQPFAAKDVRKILIKQLQSVPAQLLAHNRGMTLVVVGDLTPQALEPLLAQLVAGLPLAPAEDAPTTALPLPESRAIAMGGQLYGKTEVRYALAIADRPTTMGNTYTAELAEDIIQHRLQQSLREDNGLTYGIELFQSYQTPLARQWLLQIRFDTDPERQAEAKSILEGELARLLSEPITEQEVAEAKLRLLVSYQRLLQSNDGVERQLSWAVVLGEDPGLYDDYRNAIAAISVSDVRDFAEQWAQGHRVVATLRPGSESGKRKGR